MNLQVNGTEIRNSLTPLTFNSVTVGQLYTARVSWEGPICQGETVHVFIDRVPVSKVDTSAEGPAHPRAVHHESLQSFWPRLVEACGSSRTPERSTIPVPVTVRLVKSGEVVASAKVKDNGDGRHIAEFLVPAASDTPYEVKIQVEPALFGATFAVQDECRHAGIRLLACSGERRRHQGESIYAVVDSRCRRCACRCCSM